LLHESALLDRQRWEAVSSRERRVEEMGHARGIVIVTLLAIVLAALICSTACAETYTGNFDIRIGGSTSFWMNQFEGGGGSGYNSGGETGPWFLYPDTEVMSDDHGNQELPGFSAWWNQWFYDGNLRPGYYKLVDLSFDYQPLNPDSGPGWASITVNWSTDAWTPEQGRPPLPDDEQFIGQYIGRLEVDRLDVFGPDHYSISDVLLDLPYNPEWVSIDVRGYNFELANGQIVHECVPEPGTLIAAFGVLSPALLFFRRRK